MFFFILTLYRDPLLVCSIVKPFNKKYDTEPIISSVKMLEKKKLAIRQTVMDRAARQNLCSLIDEEILQQRVILLGMYKELMRKKSERYDPEYKPFELNHTMYEEYCKYVPKLPLDSRVSIKPAISCTFYTNVDEPEERHDFGSYFSGCSISTYPFLEYKRKRDGDPVCDQYRVYITPNHSIITLADGCNWGKAPAIAASKACKAFIDYLKRNRDLFVNTYRVSRLCLEGIAAAHNAIIAGPYGQSQRIGTTTLLGGLLSKVILPGQEGIPESNLNDWVFVFASIGDCKAFLYDSKSKKIEELTPDSRGENFLDASDCGGRIGPYIEGGPDVRNLEVFMSPCVTGDIIIICSDGVHDNFDPQMNNLYPKDLGVKQESWEDCLPSEANAAKAEWRTSEMGKIVESNDPSVEDMVDKLITYCEDKNKAAQDFMKEHQGKKLPNDYELYPGKMDHTTVVCMKVGEIPTAMLTAEFENPQFYKSRSKIRRTKSNPYDPSNVKTDDNQINIRSNLKLSKNHSSMACIQTPIRKKNLTPDKTLTNHRKSIERAFVQLMEALSEEKYSELNAKQAIAKLVSKTKLLSSFLNSIELKKRANLLQSAIDTLFTFLEVIIIDNYFLFI